MQALFWIWPKNSSLWALLNRTICVWWYLLNRMSGGLPSRRWVKNFLWAWRTTHLKWTISIISFVLRRPGELSISWQFSGLLSSYPCFDSHDCLGICKLQVSEVYDRLSLTLVGFDGTNWNDCSLRSNDLRILHRTRAYISMCGKLWWGHRANELPNYLLCKPRMLINNVRY